MDPLEIPSLAAKKTDSKYNRGFFLLTLSHICEPQNSCRAQAPDLYSTTKIGDCTSLCAYVINLHEGRMD